MSGPASEPIDFAQLYEAHTRHVHRFAVFLSGDPSLADDIVSETFVRVWHARTRVDLSTVRAYLLAIARNLYLEECRRRHRLTEIDPLTRDEQPGPEQWTRATLEFEIVRRALQSLQELDRSALLMRAEDNVSYEDIGRILGMSAAAARVRVCRARVKLAAARAPQAACAAEKENQS